MELDLLVLEEEVRKERLTFEDFKKDLYIHEFNEGRLIFDAGLDGVKMPEGYRLFYASNEDGEVYYNVGPVDLLKAENSEKWIKVDECTQARWNNGMEIKRVKNKLSGKVYSHVSGRKWAREFPSKSKFSKEEWEILKNYAYPVKRAGKLLKLNKEVKIYVHNAIREISEHLDLSYWNLPKVEISRTDLGHYLKKENKIVIGNLRPAVVYEEAGHFLHLRYAPKWSKKDTNLNMFFKIVINEAIGFYCAKLGDKNHSPLTIRRNLYGLGKSHLEKKETKLANELMERDVSVNQAIKAASLDGKTISDSILQKLQKYMSNSNKLERTSYYLAAMFGNELWGKKDKFNVKKIIKSEETNYIDLFFSTKRFMKGLDKIREDTYKKYGKQ